MPAKQFSRDIHFGSDAWIRVTGIDGDELEFMPMWKEALPSLGWKLCQSNATRHMYGPEDFHDTMAVSLLREIPPSAFVNCPEIFSYERQKRLKEWAPILWDDYTESDSYSRQFSLGEEAYIVFTRSIMAKNQITVRAYLNNNRISTFTQETSSMGLKEAKEMIEAFGSNIPDTYLKSNKIAAIKLLRTESATAYDEFFPSEKIDIDPDDDRDVEAYLGKSTLEKLRKAAEPAGNTFPPAESGFKSLVGRPSSPEPAKELRVYKRQYELTDYIFDAEITHKYEFIGIFEVANEAATLISGTISLPDGSTRSVKGSEALSTHSMEPGNWAGWERVV